MKAQKNKTLFYMRFRNRAIIVPSSIIAVYGYVSQGAGKILLILPKRSARSCRILIPILYSAYPPT